MYSEHKSLTDHTHLQRTLYVSREHTVIQNIYNIIYNTIMQRRDENIPNKKLAILIYTPSTRKNFSSRGKFFSVVLTGQEEYQPAP